MEDKSDIAVRSVTRTDEPNWRCLVLACLRFFGTEAREGAVETAVTRHFSTDLRDGVQARRGSRPAGLVDRLFRRGVRKADNVVYLRDFCVDPVARGRGDGPAVILAFPNASVRMGDRTVTGSTQEAAVGPRFTDGRIIELTPIIAYRRGQIR